MVYYTYTINNNISEKSYKILAIGDPHIQINNLSYIDSYIEQIVNIVKLENPKCVVLLGDIMHHHEVVLTLCFKQAEKLIHELRKHTIVYVLVGNHDLINNSQFLTNNHWLNPFKYLENVIIVDTVTFFYIENDLFICLPYVPPSRFIEALNTLPENINWKDAKSIFCHQEFKGCKMGAITSSDGDKWDIDDPLVIAGHVHEKQIPQKNIVYVGSSMQHSFGETCHKTVMICDYINNSVVFNDIELNLPTKRLMSVSFDELSKTSNIVKKDNQELRITISGGSIDEFKVFKKTKDYKNLIKQGIKIVHRPELINISNNEEEKQDTFEDILFKLVDECNNKDIMDLYKEIIL